ncbi:DUF2306 domain-containing protein [Paenibacillus sp. YPG26]|uniref:DUF2306 domain-containing protein n=1 Tax=Paenibacillus sp. YPG26 TaxID=2878915 RepID=UPI00204266AD|nr:DUF2306 domain-containing protein [Paenibacillus sp. YPG26]USB33516.1 DUF2306 domain-containing protein [Paenibacillus sp. YPG26]
MFQQRTKRIWGAVIAILALGVSIYLGVQYFGFGAASSGLIQDKVNNQHLTLSDLYFLVLYIHIAAGIIAISIGWIQFIDSIREKYRGLHRTLGIIYSGCVIFSGASGIFIAFKATGGWVSTAAFLLLSLSWLFTLTKGLRAIIVEQDPRKHKNWMLRNYALTLAAVTLRIYLPISMLLFGLEHFNVYYRVIAWICWIPNLIFAEWIIGRIPSRWSRSYSTVHK